MAFPFPLKKLTQQYPRVAFGCEIAGSQSHDHCSIPPIVIDGKVEKDRILSILSGYGKEHPSCATQ